MADETPQDRKASEAPPGRPAARPRQDRPAADKEIKGASPGAGTGASGPEHPRVHTRADRYLVAAAPPTDIRAIAEQLEQDESGRVLRVLAGRGTPGRFPGVAVVEMTAEYAATLAAYPGIHVEPDYTVGPSHAVAPPVVTQRVAFEVVDDGMRPIEGASVTVTHSGCPATGFTGPDGRAEIILTPEALAAPSAIEIHPPRGCWPVRVRRPLLASDDPLRLVCTRITTTSPEF